MHRTSFVIALTTMGFLAPASATGAVILPQSMFIEVAEPTQLRVLWLIEDATVPLLGYSLNFERSVDFGDPARGLNGAVLNVGQTNFFDQQNLFTAAGVDRDPFFSVIQANTLGGVFVSTNSDDLSTVLPVAGLNDVLIEMVLEIDPSQPGDYRFSLAPGTALSDGDGFPVSYAAEYLTVRVLIPAPAGAALVFSAFACASRRRR